MGLRRLPEGYEEIMEAVESARKDGEIGVLEYWRIKQRCKNEDCCREVREAILHEAKSARIPMASKDNGAPDWSSILEFIKQLIPLILQIVKLFA